MAQSETVDRILDAAEELFAERGFSETSLRMITSHARVNLAAVNYHFGSKKALIQAVFARFLTPF
ncbi:MAG: TetR/AcrR family transcriptional regulator, partial [Halomonadaceae bacterium]